MPVTATTGSPSSSPVPDSPRTAALTRSISPWGAGGGGGAGGGAGAGVAVAAVEAGGDGSATFSPVNSRKEPQQLQKSAPSSL